MKRIIGLMLVMCIFLSIGLVFPQDTDNGEGVENLWKIAGFENEEDLEVAELKESTKHDQDGKITVSVNTDGNVKYKHGKENEKREFKNIEEGSNFTFENGKLVEANFKTKGDKATKYKLGNYEYTIPPGSQVTYKIGEENEKDTVIIIQPAGSVTKPPEIINSSLKKEVEVEIKTDEKGVLKISQGNVGAVEKSNGGYTQKETSLFYGHGRKDEIRMYTKEKYTTFFTEEGKPEFTIINLDEGELDLVFDNKRVDAERSSVLVTENEIGSINLKGGGAIISIASDNRLGIGKGQLKAGKKTLSYQGKNGYAVLEKGLGEDNPLIKLQGESLYGPDSRVFLGDADRKEFYYKPNKVIEGVKNGDGAIAINAKLYDKDNKPLPYVILTTNENSHLLAPEKDLRGPEKYYVKEGVVYSANAAFNQLTPAQRKAKVDLREGVNSMDAQTHRFVNRFRMQFKGGTNLKWDPKIAAVSLEHSKLMASRGYIGHYGFEGRLRQLGGSGSENVAMFGDSQKYSAEEVGRRFSQMWIGSPGHMRNMIGGHTKTGIGVYMVERRPGYYEYYATQIFQ